MAILENWKMLGNAIDSNFGFNGENTNEFAGSGSGSERRRVLTQ